MSTINTWASVSPNSPAMSWSTTFLTVQSTISLPQGKYLSPILLTIVFRVFYSSFNAKLIPRDDKSMEARSRRYGTRTMFDTAANHQPEDYFTTTTRASFLSPRAHDKPNWRSRDRSQLFENSAKLRIHKRSDTNASGYESNRQLGDGTTWTTEKNLHTDQYRTSYRNGFNQPKPFHKPELKITDGRLKRKQQIFDVTDKWTDKVFIGMEQASSGLWKYGQRLLWEALKRFSSRFFACVSQIWLVGKLHSSLVSL